MKNEPLLKKSGFSTFQIMSDFLTEVKKCDTIRAMTNFKRRYHKGNVYQT